MYRQRLRLENVLPNIQTCASGGTFTCSVLSWSTLHLWAPHHFTVDPPDQNLPHWYGLNQEQFITSIWDSDCHIMKMTSIQQWNRLVGIIPIKVIFWKGGWDGFDPMVYRGDMCGPIASGSFRRILKPHGMIQSNDFHNDEGDIQTISLSSDVGWRSNYLPHECWMDIVTTEK